MQTMVEEILEVDPRCLGELKAEELLEVIMVVELLVEITVELVKEEEVRVTSNRLTGNYNYFMVAH